jgi:hypothetical protein
MSDINFITIRSDFKFENVTFDRIRVDDSRSSEAMCPSYSPGECEQYDNALIKVEISSYEAAVVGNISHAVFRDITIINRIARFHTLGDWRGPRITTSPSPSPNVVPCLFKLQHLRKFYLTNMVIDRISGSQYQYGSDYSQETLLYVNRLAPYHRALDILRVDGISPCSTNQAEIVICDSIIIDIIDQTGLFTFLQTNIDYPRYQEGVEQRVVTIANVIFRKIRVIEAFEM